jgi:hypothetical protein
MAKTPAGVLGPFSGKVGNVVGASWKGIKYIRQYVVPANPDTDAQKAERGLFADLVHLAKAALGPVLQVFWDPFLRGISGWAEFIGVNRDLYEATDDYSPVLMARGTLEGAVIATAIYSTTVAIITWDGTVLGNGSADDVACVFVYDEEHKVGFFSTNATRSTESLSVSVGTGRTAAKLNAWLFFADSATAPTQVSYSDHEVCSTP